MINPSSNTPGRPDRPLQMQALCTLLVALSAAYVSYRHGHEFALRFGADSTTAMLWPLIVDGMVTMATIELWKTSHHDRETGQWKAWLAFTLGIGLSLSANIASAPELTPPAIAVAACPPLALLLSVELLNQALKRRHSETTSRAIHQSDEAQPGPPPSTVPDEASPSPEAPEKVEEVPALRTAVNNAPGQSANSADADSNPPHGEDGDPLLGKAHWIDAEHWNLLPTPDLRRHAPPEAQHRLDTSPHPHPPHPPTPPTERTGGSSLITTGDRLR